ncbi:MAG: hypothetical protein ABSE48_15615 [Verrucomicrobiota bacterium]|jgi:hypothetical protein
MKIPSLPQSAFRNALLGLLVLSASRGGNADLKMSQDSFDLALAWIF